jgi:transposase
MSSNNCRDLTDAQWRILDPPIPEPSQRKDGRGRPWKDRRAVLNGILWVLRTGAPWADLPDRYPPYQTCHRRFQQWVRSGILKMCSKGLAVELKVRGLLNVREAFIDGSFAAAKRGTKGGKTKRGKGTKIMVVADSHGLPVGLCTERASPHEVKLVNSTLVAMVILEAPQNRVGDDAYDSDKLDAELREVGIELIARHRSNRKNKSQDGRRFRPCRRRWKIERLFAWLQNCRRLVVRYERYPNNSLGMLHLGCCLILMRHL